MAIVRYKPQDQHNWGMLDQLYREMNSLFEPQGNQTSALDAVDFAPAVDVKEDDQHYEVHVDLPGVKPEEVEVTAENGALEIKGERNSELKESQKGYSHIERHYGRFMRRFNLPEDVDAERIEAKCEHGVLHITLPKTAESSPRRITVR